MSRTTRRGVTGGLRVTASGLDGSGHVWPAAALLGFHEHFDAWRGVVWLQVAGPDLWVRADDTYGALRAQLRQRFPELPFTSDWARTGRFEGLVAGGAPAPWWAFAVLVTGAVVAVSGAIGGVFWGVVAAACWLVPLARLRAGLEVHAVGLRAGPLWAPLVAWHEVDAVVAQPLGAGMDVRVLSRRGVGRVHVPLAVWPAVQARLWRLGGVRVQRSPVTLDERYVGWRAAARGAPWGVLAGTVVGALVVPQGWTVVALGGLAAGAVGFVGGAVEARLDGWRTGGILWMTLAYATVLLAWVLAALQ